MLILVSLGKMDAMRAFAAVSIHQPADHLPEYQLAVGWTWWQTRNLNSQYWGAYGGEGELGKGWDANGRVPLKKFIKK